MADIALANQNTLLIRKIGYSVGLEDTVNRIALLTETLVQDKELRDSNFNDLIVNKFGRKESTKTHFINFFSSLDLLELTNGRIVPHEILNASCLLRNDLDDNDFKEAVKGITLYTLLISDGELFLNLLSTGFKKDQYLKQLTNYRKEKIQFFYNHYAQKSIKEKIHKIIDFKEVVTNDNNINKGPLIDKKRSGPFAKNKTDIHDFTVKISDDWYTKVPERRKSWAQSLGLFKDNEVSENGHTLLEGINSLSHKTLSSYIIFPTDLELSRFKLSTLLPKENILNVHDILSVITKSFSKLFDKDLTENKTLLKDTNDLSELIKHLEPQYINLDKRFTKLRRELPYFTLLLYLTGRSIVEKKNIDNIRDLIEELISEKKDVLVRKSRKTLFGLTTKR